MLKKIFKYNPSNTFKELTIAGIKNSQKFLLEMEFLKSNIKISGKAKAVGGIDIFLKYRKRNSSTSKEYL